MRYYIEERRDYRYSNNLLPFLFWADYILLAPTMCVEEGVIQHTLTHTVKDRNTVLI